MTTHTISLLTSHDARTKRAALIDLLVDSVEGGASVNFVLPMPREKAERWWDDALASQVRGERLIFAAEMDGRLDGSVQLILAPQENQFFRADLAKMLVHRRARRQGIGAALIVAAESEARRVGRTMLTLDTVAGSAADRLYARMGWTKFGEIPGYAVAVDNRTRDNVSFFYKSL